MLERVKAFLSFSEFFSVVVVAVVVFDAVVVVVAEVVEFSIIPFQKRKTLNCFRQINSRPKKTAESLVLIDFSGRNCFQMETVPHKINKLKNSLLPTRGFRNGLIL